MKNIYIALTDSGYWGKGETLAKAINNAKTSFNNNIGIALFSKKDGSEFTDTEYEEIYFDGMSLFYFPESTIHIPLGLFKLRDLTCMSDPEKISAEFIYVTENLLGDTKVQIIEDILRNSDIIV